MFNIYRLLSTVRETFCCVLVSFTHFYTANRQILTPLYILESTTFCQILGKKAQPSPPCIVWRRFFFSLKCSNWRCSPLTWYDIRFPFRLWDSCSSLFTCLAAQVEEHRKPEWLHEHKTQSTQGPQEEKRSSEYTKTLLMTSSDHFAQL